MENEREIKTSFPLEWEYQAFQEVKDWFLNRRWKNNIKSLNDHIEINRKILDNLKSDQIGFKRLILKSKNKELNELFNKILNELIYIEPVLTRVFIHNSTLPEDINVRIWLRNNYLPESHVTVMFLYELFDFDLLVNSELAKNFSVNGIPLRHFVVGKILERLLRDFEYYTYFDLIKLAGVKESIEELRKNRIYETKEGMVYDFSPLFKKVFSGNTVVIEYFKKEDFENFKWLSYKLDDMICFAIQKAYPDFRQHLYFGDDITNLDCKYIIQYGTEKKEIPFQLLPKWINKVKKTASGYRFTTHTHIVKKLDKDNKTFEVVKAKEDEMQEGVSGLFKGVLAWKKEEGPATPHLEKSINWRLGDAFDELSTEGSQKERHQYMFEQLKSDFSNTDEKDLQSYIDRKFKKQILKERIESSGSSLDEAIKNPFSKDGTDEDNETRRDFLSVADFPFPKQTLSPDDTVFLSEILKNYPEMQAILKKQEDGKPLTAKERKNYERTVKKLNKQFSNNL